jgi:hypothetical protein
VKNKALQPLLLLNIESGECYIFPKIDGTNVSVWLDENGELQAGSRKRHLTVDNDIAEFSKNHCLLNYKCQN